MKSKRTKATSISTQTAQTVWLRDKGVCVLCGAMGSPTAHFIARSQGGLGIEQNIVTLCDRCHHRYDQTTEREQIREMLRNYLKSKYADWDERKLVYKNNWLEKAMKELEGKNG